MNKTIAQQLGITEFPFIIKNKDGNRLYYEISDNTWVRREYDSDNNETYFEDCEGYWIRREFDSEGNQIYYQDSKGKIIDNRPNKNAESTMILREMFRQIRLGKHNHLGLGDIRLTVAQQDEICYLVESLIEKSKNTEQ
jgi:hypothetical protein